MLTARGRHVIMFIVAVVGCLYSPTKVADVCKLNILSYRTHNTHARWYAGVRCADMANGTSAVCRHPCKELVQLLADIHDMRVVTGNLLEDLDRVVRLIYLFTCTKMDYTSHAKGWLTIWQGVCHSYLFIALDNDDWNSLHGKCFGMAQRELWIMNEQKWNDKIHDRKKSLSIYFAIVKLDSSPNVHNVSHGIRWD